ncbi:MAG: hemerythrin domain-containing protein [Candidatus Eremiobacteraeota bacterium]|nr:hemerythrin domain-containing protein [Candidatus Eremiobacteraeota bacterium]
MNRCNDRIDIQTCRDQHVALTYLLDQFNTGEPVGETRTIGLLQRLRTVLVHHLRLEDDCLYPRLRHSNNLTVRETARTYQAEMGNLKQAFAELYARWTQRGAISMHPADYLANWREFEIALRKRMTAEDDDLYIMAEAEFESKD